MAFHKNFDHPPDQGQLAKNGEWEKAVFFIPGQFQDEISARAYLDGGREVACEAFFKGAFFGTRRIAEPEKLVVFLTEFARVLSSAKNGKDFFEAVEHRCNIPLAIHFKFAEVGAINAWNSIGAFKIKDPKHALETFDDLWQELISQPVSLETSHAKAIEFVYDNGDGTTHWIACPISEMQPPFKIDKNQLKEAMLSFCNSRYT